MVKADLERVTVKTVVLAAFIEKVRYVSVHDLKITDRHDVVSDRQDFRVVYCHFLHDSLNGAYSYVIADPERSCRKQVEPSYKIPYSLGGRETYRSASEGRKRDKLLCGQPTDSDYSGDSTKQYQKAKSQD